MPRSTQDIMSDDDETLAARFLTYEPRPEDERDVTGWHALVEAIEARSASERSIVEAVRLARSLGYSWAIIGGLLGTTGQSARERYGKLVEQVSA